MDDRRPCPVKLSRQHRREKAARGENRPIRRTQNPRSSSTAREQRGFTRPPWPELPDDSAARAVQRQTFRFFWEGAHAGSGLAPDRRGTADRARSTDLVTMGGSGFGIMAMMVAVERGWITREAALERLAAHARFADPRHLLSRRLFAFHQSPHRRHHSVHAQGRWRRSGGDLLPVAWDCCVRGNIFNRPHQGREEACGTASPIYGKKSNGTGTPSGGRELLYWHWSPNNGWAMNHEIRGWNECLITYVLAAAAPRHAIEAERLSPRLCSRPQFLNGKSLLRHRVAARHALRRPAVLRPLLVLRTRSARPQGPLRGLLAAEPAARAHQSRPLHRQSASATRATDRTAGV